MNKEKSKRNKMMSFGNKAKTRSQSIKSQKLPTAQGE